MHLENQKLAFYHKIPLVESVTAPLQPPPTQPGSPASGRRCAGERRHNGNRRRRRKAWAERKIVCS